MAELMWFALFGQSAPAARGIMAWDVDRAHDVQGSDLIVNVSSIKCRERDFGQSGGLCA